jgi:predicted nucleic acid-binding protein
MKNHVVMDASYFIDFLNDVYDSPHEWMKNNRIIINELFIFEIANWLRRNLNFSERIMVALNEADTITIPLQLLEIEEVSKLAYELDLSGYDASYLYLAKKHKCALATNDAELKRAALGKKIKVFSSVTDDLEKKKKHKK